MAIFFGQLEQRLQTHQVFCRHVGLYRSKQTLRSIVNERATFQSLRGQNYRNLQGPEVRLAFLEDVIIYSTNFSTPMTFLRS